MAGLEGWPVFLDLLCKELFDWDYKKSVEIQEGPVF
jgi:hypothetical protein